MTDEQVIAVPNETLTESTNDADGASAGRYPPELLDTLACEIGARPAAAPHFDDVARWIREVRRVPGALLVDYDRAAAQTLEQVVNAERLCRPGIGWEIEQA